MKRDAWLAALGVWLTLAMGACAEAKPNAATTVTFTPWRAGKRRGR